MADPPPSAAPAGLPDAVHDLVEYEIACAWHDGYAAGRAAADAAYRAVLAVAFGGTDCTSLRDGVRRHLAVLDARERRAESDRGEVAA